MAATIRSILLVSLASLSLIGAANILAVFPMSSKSHAILGDGIVKLLLAAGHQVTYIAPDTSKPHKNLRWIDVSSNHKLSFDDVMNTTKLINGETDPNDIVSLCDKIVKNGNNTYTEKAVLELIMEPTNKFDVIILEWMFSELGAGLSVVFDCPLIWFSTMEPHWMVTRLIDERLSPAYNPSIPSENVPPFTLLQRAQELWKQIMATMVLNYLTLPYEKEIYQKTFGPALRIRGRELPPLEDVRFNASLMLGNSHVSLGAATRLPQNYKPIAGYHIDRDVNPLPEDLKRIMESNKNGIIYFSLGTHLKSKDIPEQLKRDLLNMFATLKYTVLWKFEEVLTDLPKNVHILKWAPQPSILAHPNTVLFITHGGLLSTTETVHFGVPIVGVPAFADQFTNVDRAVQKGFAKRVDLSYTMPDKLKAAIEDVLGNPKYKEKVKELSLIYHDRPVTPDKEVVFWVEHVIKTRGAPHLRSPGLYVPWYQKLYLDLLAVIGAVLVTITIIVKRLCCTKKTRNDQKKRD